MGQSVPRSMVLVPISYSGESEQEDLQVGDGKKELILVSLKSAVKPRICWPPEASQGIWFKTTQKAKNKSKSKWSLSQAPKEDSITTHCKPSYLLFPLFLCITFQFLETLSSPNLATLSQDSPITFSLPFSYKSSFSTLSVENPTIFSLSQTRSLFFPLYSTKRARPSRHYKLGVGGPWRRTGIMGA